MFAMVHLGLIHPLADAERQIARGCSRARLPQMQGIDWRDKRAVGCNAGRNPIQESFYDGVNVDPLEVLFVKVKASMRDARWPHVLQVPPPHPLPPLPPPPLLPPPPRADM